MNYKRSYPSIILFLTLFHSFLFAKEPLKIRPIFGDEFMHTCGFENNRGEIVVPIDDQNNICDINRPDHSNYPDTQSWGNYGIINQSTHPDWSIFVVTPEGEFTHKIHLFDNGPDYPSDGLFRIIEFKDNNALNRFSHENKLIGYADQITGEMVIKPQFECASPFENGQAKVSLDCEWILEHEHYEWKSDHWFYIDKAGNRIESPIP